MQAATYRRVQVIDSHTGGEPTRVVVAGGPDLNTGSLAERRATLARNHTAFLSAVNNEPRGSDVLVSALLIPPENTTSVAGVIFFNNVGCLNMCGHGTIGVAETLAHLGRIQPGIHRLDTPVGVVTIEYHGDHRTTIENVPSFRYAKKVPVTVPGHGVIHGDIAWGGNWFFLCEDHGQALATNRCEDLTAFTWRIRQSLEQAGITGENGALIDHIELFGPPLSSHNHSRNFVLCPGKAYDRSPCGTGTSAKLACLHADGKLAPGETWRQESILSSVFEGTYRLAGDKIIPRITGSAYITAESTLLFDALDPFADGIRTST